VRCNEGTGFYGEREGKANIYPDWHHHQHGRVGNERMFGQTSGPVKTVGLVGGWLPAFGGNGNNFERRKDMREREPGKRGEEKEKKTKTQQLCILMGLSKKRTKRTKF